MEFRGRREVAFQNQNLRHGRMDGQLAGEAGMPAGSGKTGMGTAPFLGCFFFVYCLCRKYGFMCLYIYMCNFYGSSVSILWTSVRCRYVIARRSDSVISANRNMKWCRYGVESVSIRTVSPKGSSEASCLDENDGINFVSVTLETGNRCSGEEK